ncbi:MAG: hypothetical protein F6K41_19160 [Symploca sp. SIO3E6]|nr:hypothetical protein [Caldora sp. SIO3E6]
MKALSGIACVLIQQALTSTDVQTWIEQQKKEELSDEKWLIKEDGAKLLKNLFRQFSEARVEFSKTNHSYQLTEWLVNNQPEYLRELANFLHQDVLERGQKSAII